MKSDAQHLGQSKWHCSFGSSHLYSLLMAVLLRAYDSRHSAVRDDLPLQGLLCDGEEERSRPEACRGGDARVITMR